MRTSSPDDPPPSRLESIDGRGDNESMQLAGSVQNGVVVLTNGACLPEGAAVTVIYCQPPAMSQQPDQRRVSFPLVRSAAPGSVNLISDRIAEILDEEDAPPGR